MYDRLKNGVFQQNEDGSVKISIVNLLTNCLSLPHLDLDSLTDCVHSLKFQSMNVHDESRRILCSDIPPLVVDKLNKSNFLDDFKNKVVFLVLGLCLIGYQLNNWGYIYFTEETTDL